MNISLWKPAALALVCALANASAAAADPDEAALHAACDAALWPGDIVRAADRYLLAYPEGPAAAEIKVQREHAAAAWRLVSRNDVRLYRTAFVAGGDAQPDLRRAALGDREAALRLARDSRTADETAGTQRFEGWLQYAAALGDERASYQLALHYRRTEQPVLAAKYEALALALGYQPPAALDNTRK